MKKKYFFILPVVAVIISFVRFANTTEKSDLIAQNVEALTQSESDISDVQKRRQECFNKGGIWGYHSTYLGTKDVDVTGAGGFEVIWKDKKYSVSFTTKKGRIYHLPFTEYKCEADPQGTKDENMNCCTKQGLYYGEEKVG